MEIYCLKGGCSSPRLFGVVISQMAGARNSGDWPEDGTSWELGIIKLRSIFFLGRESSLFCIEWWGGPGGAF